MLLLISMPFRENLWLTYVAGVVGATILEYITGVVMLALFKVRYWDYSNQKLNFQGHICVSSSIAWGGLTVVMSKFLHPQVERVVALIPTPVFSGVVSVVFLVAGIDFGISFHAAFELREIILRVERIKDEVVHEINLYQKRLDVVLALMDDRAEKAKKNMMSKIRTHFVKASIRNNPAFLKANQFQDTLEVLWQGIVEKVKSLRTDESEKKKTDEE